MSKVVTRCDALQVLRIEVLDGYPRLEHGGSQEVFWAARLYAAQHSVPCGPLDLEAGPRVDWRDLDAVWERLLSAAGALLRSDPIGGTAAAAVVAVDLDRRVGRALGGIGAYAFVGGSVEVLHRATLADSIVAAQDGDAEVDPIAAKVYLGFITPRGIEGDNPSEMFSFERADALVLSSEPLHWKPWWPPASPSEVVQRVLEERDWREQLLALWTRSEVVRGR